MLNMLTSFTHFRQFKISQCNVCKKRFASADLLQIHMTFPHPNIEPLSLEQFDDSSFLNLTELITEESAAIEQTTESTKKPVRGKKKKQPIKKNVAKKSLKCTVACHEKVIKRQSLWNLISQVHVKKRSFCCDYCGKGFFQKYQLQSHLYSHIPPDLQGRNQNCLFCSKTFYSKELLKAHNRYAHADSVPGKIWNCECGKQYKNKNLLYQHKKIHNREAYMRTCEHCGKVFADGRRLKEHIKIFHTDGGRGNFMCSECGKHYDSLQLLKSHFRSHSEPKIPCDEPGCEKMFLFLNQLKSHKKRIHLKVKDYTCDRPNCGKAFAANTALLRHIKVTHEKHRVKCPVEDCKFMVGRRDYMKNHIRKHVELKPEVQTQMLESVKELIG
jgi:Zinc finger, C2H2 type